MTVAVCLCMYVQAPNTADLRRGGTCWRHPLGAGRHVAAGVDLVLLLYMERRQVDRQSEWSDVIRFIVLHARKITVPLGGDKV